MKRNGYSVRSVTSVGQELPHNWCEIAAKFRTHVKNIKAKNAVRLKDFGNMDEVPCQFDMPGKRTVDVKGKQGISITTTGESHDFFSQFLGAEKSNYTVVLGCTADGGKLLPMVIFKRKTIPREDFPEGK